MSSPACVMEAPALRKYCGMNSSSPTVPMVMPANSSDSTHTRRFAIDDRIECVRTASISLCSFASSPSSQSRSRGSSQRASRGRSVRKNNQDADADEDGRQPFAEEDPLPSMKSGKPVQLQERSGQQGAPIAADRVMLIMNQPTTRARWCCGNHRQM